MPRRIASADAAALPCLTQAVNINCFGKYSQSQTTYEATATEAMASDREKLDKSKMNSSVKHIPKDAQVIMSILKELNVTEYEPRVINQLLEFTYRTYCGHKVPTTISQSNLIGIFVRFNCAFDYCFLFAFLHRIHHMHFGRCENLCESCEEKSDRFGRCETGIANDDGENVYVATTPRSMCFV